MAKPEPLGVWLYGTRIAELTSTGPGDVTLLYSEQALERWPSNTPLLSCTLPLSTRRQKAGVYFKGMLPEGRILQALAAQAKLSTFDVFGLLARFGRDVAGAAVIAATAPGERLGSVEPYDAAGLADEVANLEDRPLGVHDDSELSLAGLQNKLLLVADGDGWGRPVGGRPSTHILKVEDRRYPGLVAMEAACLRLARAVGLTTVDVTLETFADLPCIIVSRFDRVVERDGTVRRVHQEDTCQALGRDPDLNRGRGKYEAFGGPSLVEIAKLLDRWAGDPVAQLERLVAAVTFTVAIGNADAHGKNVSLLHDSPGVVSLAPLYDTVPTGIWPKLPDRAAMAINDKVSLSAVTLDDIAAEAGTWNLSRDRARVAAADTAERLIAALAAVEVPEELAKAVRARAQAVLRS
jgi:serine/threonine-protein kinase HipA